MPDFITLFNVTKTYRVGKEQIKALNNISLRIGSGDFVAITGASGSGKTTLAQVIGGLVTPSAGSVIVDDQRVSDLNDRHLAAFRNKNVGFVFQNFALLNHYTASENVMIPMYVAGISKAERTQKAKHYLGLVDLSAQADRLGKTLSGGQRQRVAIARALAMEPRIIIADEPTGNLDSKNGQGVIDALETLVTRLGTTVILVTHDPVLADRTHRRIHLKDGGLSHAHN